jgi:hypothetical protein
MLTADNDARIQWIREANQILGGGNSLKLEEICNLFRVMKIKDLLRIPSIQKEQELNESVEWMRISDDPMMIIYISHQWESAEHPDPRGRQLAAIKQLARNLIDVSIAIKLDPAARIDLVPTLKEHGAIQAAYFLGKVAPFIDSFQGTPDDLRWRLENGIGFWYDFTCLPQEPRSHQESQDFNNALFHLHEFLRVVEVLALRDFDDKYSERAWCELEFWAGAKSSGSTWSTVPVLRMDLIGGKISTRSDMEDIGPPSNFTSYESFSNLRQALIAWEGFETVIISRSVGKRRPCEFQY